MYIFLKFFSHGFLWCLFLVSIYLRRFHQVLSKWVSLLCCYQDYTTSYELHHQNIYLSNIHISMVFLWCPQENQPFESHSITTKLLSNLFISMPPRSLLDLEDTSSLFMAYIGLIVYDVTQGGTYMGLNVYVKVVPLIIKRSHVQHVNKYI